MDRLKYNGSSSCMIGAAVLQRNEFSDSFALLLISAQPSIDSPVVAIPSLLLQRTSRELFSSSLKVFIFLFL